MSDGLILPPGTPEHLRGRLVEVARREWPDPADFDFEMLETFLTDQGVLGRPAGDLASGVAAPAGAALLLSGDLRPHSRTSRPQPSPAAGVPAVCAIVYAVGSKTRPGTSGSQESARIGDWTPSWTPRQHAQSVVSVRQAIAAGDVYQVSIVGHQSANFSGRPGAVGDALDQLPGTPFSGAMTGAGWSVFSASPECLLGVRDGIAVTRPIKGTVAAAGDPAADERARARLASSVKDHAEHVMIVDLARNDLGRVAAVGGVRVPELYAVRRLAGVWHAESTVTATLAPGVRLSQLLDAVFPGGSVTGAPKLAALDLIDRLEPVGRGPSMGALGWIGADGSMQLGLTIRTVAVTEGRIHLWTGGGITWGSEPDEEVAEAAVKAAPLLRRLASIGS
ncbi:MAG: chorismate-binding protein [Actinomycetota bacterium]